MKNTIIVYLCFVILLTSCWGKTSSEARQECYTNQIGTYKFDTKKTIMGDDFSKDSIRLSKLVIQFLPDSTFKTNFKPLFLDDSFGYWDAGTCGFENWGKMRFQTSPHVMQFDPCQSGDSFLCIIGKIRRGDEATQYLWFSKVP